MAKTGSIKITQISQDLVNGTTTFNVYASITTSGESYRGDHNKFILRLNRDSEYILPTWFDTLSGWTVVKDSSGNRLYVYYSVGVPQNTTKQLCNFNVTLKHYSTGTSGTISASFDYADGWCTASTSTTFPSIQPKSTLTAPSGTLGEELAITVKKNNANFTHTIRYTINNFIETICEKSSDTEIKWTPPIDLASAFPNSPSGAGRISIETFNGNTSLGSNTYGLTLSIPDTLVPIIDNVYIVDVNGFADVFGAYVKGKSSLKITTEARGVYGSTITNYDIRFDGAMYSSETVITNVIRNTGALYVWCGVTDSRGQFSGFTETKIITIDYSPPKINSLKAIRCDATNNAFTKYNPQGAYFSVEFETDFADLNGKTVDYQLAYKKVSDTDYTRVYKTETLEKSGRFIIPADVYSTYNVELTIMDYFTFATKSTIGYSARRVFDIWKSKFSIAFGKVCELENAFEVLFENIKLTGTKKVSIEGQDIDLVPSGNLLYNGNNFFGGRQLWNGQSLMNETHSITFDKPISQMKNGILLVFGRNGTYNLTPYFVPKETVSAYGKTTYSFPLCTELFDYVGAKSLYISDTKIEGHTNNDATAKNGTSGITYHNEAFYLLKVYEV